MEPKILYEDGEILVCVKPAGIPTQTDRIGSKDMVSILKNYRAAQEGCKNPYLGVVHRLDQPVSGILVFGKTKEATAELGRQLQRQEMKKEYLALCLGKPKQEGELIHYLKKDHKTGMAVVTDEQDQEGKPAKLFYWIEEQREETVPWDVYDEQQKKGKEEEVSLVRIRLETGRFHQIRAQFLAYGHPLLGDQKYKTTKSEEVSRRLNLGSVSLCAVSLRFCHPAKKKQQAAGGGKELSFTLKKEDLPKWENIGRW